MADNNTITWDDLHVLGYTIVDAHFFGKNGVRLSPAPKLPKNLAYPMKGDIIFKLEVIEPKVRQGEVIETVEQLKTL